MQRHRGDFFDLVQDLFVDLAAQEQGLQSAIRLIDESMGYIVMQKRPTNRDARRWKQMAEQRMVAESVLHLQQRLYTQFMCEISALYIATATEKGTGILVQIMMPGHRSNLRNCNIIDSFLHWFFRYPWSSLTICRKRCLRWHWSGRVT